MAHGNEVNSKRYYWLKLETKFFTNARIVKLRKLAGGDTYTIIYLKLMLLSIDSEGILIFEGVEETFEEELALKINEDVENVQVTIAYLKSQGLIEEKELDYFLPQAKELIDSETHGNFVRRINKSKLGLANCKPNANQKLTNANQMLTNIDIDIEKEKEIDIEQELNKKKDNSCGKASEKPNPPKYQIPLVSNEFGDIYEEDIEIWKKAYPAVDVEEQIKIMIAWCMSNPKYQKTKQGYKRFVNNWLSTEQNKARMNKSNNSQGYSKPSQSYTELLKDTII